MEHVAVALKLEEDPRNNPGPQGEDSGLNLGRTRPTQGRRASRKYA